jgi:hypothetical protein
LVGVTSAFETFFSSNLISGPRVISPVLMIISWIDSKLLIGGLLALIALGVTAAALALERMFGHTPLISFFALIVAVVAAWGLALRAAKR